MVRRRGSESPFSLFSFQDIITSVTGIVLLCTLLLALELIDRTEAAPSESTPDQVEQLEQTLTELQKQIDELEQQLQRDASWLEQLAEVVPGQLPSQIAEIRAQLDQLRAENAALKQELAAQRTKQRQVEMESQPNVTDEQKRAELDARLADLEEQLNELRDSQRLLFRPAAGGRQAWLVEITDKQYLAAQVGRDGKPMVFDDSLLTRRSDSFARFAATRKPSDEYFVLFVKPTGIEAYKDLQERLKELGFAVGLDLIGPEEVVVDPVKGTSL